MTVADNVAFGLERKGVPKAQLKGRVAEMLELVGRPGSRNEAEAALRRTAAACRPRARARQSPARAAPRRAARRARPQAPEEHADGAEADPERPRHHLRTRHARPGGGDDDGRHDRCHEQRQDRQLGPPAELYERPATRIRCRLSRRLESAAGTSTAREPSVSTTARSSAPASTAVPARSAAE